MRTSPSFPASGIPLGKPRAWDPSPTTSEFISALTMRSIHRCLLLTAQLGLLAFAADAQTLTTTRVASGLSSPVHATSAPGDATRLFLVEQRGLIKVLDLTTNTVLAAPFLETRGGEEPAERSVA